MGGWVAAVYTEEQQARLGVAEDGTPAAPAPAPTESAANPAPAFDTAACEKSRRAAVGG